MENNPEMEHYGFFLHKHIPTTMFINTYTKRFPDIKIPLYQAGIVLRKRGNFLDPGYPVEKERTIRKVSDLISPTKKEKSQMEYDKGYNNGFQAALDIVSFTLTKLKNGKV
jgi:hypothetical protein